MDGIAVGFGVVLAITIVEIVLSARWNLFYFTVGLPIFVRRIDRVVAVAELSLDELQKSTATVAGTPILFRRLGPDAIAFREKGLGGSIHYMPIMHGLIRRRAEEATVVVLGFANWYIVALILMFAVLMGKNFLDVALYLVGAVAIVYLIPGHPAIRESSRCCAARNPWGGIQLVRTIAITVGMLTPVERLHDHRLVRAPQEPVGEAVVRGRAVELGRGPVRVSAAGAGQPHRLQRLSLVQLKILQEVITLCVFAPFAVFYMRQPLNLDFLWAALCMVGAVFFMFR